MALVSTTLSAWQIRQAADAGANNTAAYSLNAAMKTFEKANAGGAHTRNLALIVVEKEKAEALSAASSAYDDAMNTAWEALDDADYVASKTFALAVEAADALRESTVRTAVNARMSTEINTEVDRGLVIEKLARTRTLAMSKLYWDFIGDNELEGQIYLPGYFYNDHSAVQPYLTALKAYGDARAAAQNQLADDMAPLTKTLRQAQRSATVTYDDTLRSIAATSTNDLRALGESFSDGVESLEDTLIDDLEEHAETANEDALDAAVTLATAESLNAKSALEASADASESAANSLSDSGVQGATDRTNAIATAIGTANGVTVTLVTAPLSTTTASTTVASANGASTTQPASGNGVAMGAPPAGGGEDPVPTAWLNFGPGYWHYFWNPSAMETDLQIAQGAAVGVAIGAGGLATGLAAASAAGVTQVGAVPLTRMAAQVAFETELGLPLVAGGGAASTQFVNWQTPITLSLNQMSQFMANALATTSTGLSRAGSMLQSHASRVGSFLNGLAHGGNHAENTRVASEVISYILRNGQATRYYHTGYKCDVIAVRLANGCGVLFRSDGSFLLFLKVGNS